MPKPYLGGQIGQPGPGQNLYGAGLNGARLTIDAPSLYAASKAALEFWKPSKKDAGHVWVRLHQLAGADQPVVHVADF